MSEKNFDALYDELDKQIKELTVFDSQLDKVATSLLKEVAKQYGGTHKPTNNTGNYPGVPNYKNMKKSPEFLDSVAALTKARLDSKKALIKAYIDQINLKLKANDDKKDQVKYAELFEAFKKANSKAEGG